MARIVTTVLVWWTMVLIGHKVDASEEQRAWEFVQSYNDVLQSTKINLTRAMWNYQTNLTKPNEALMGKANERLYRLEQTHAVLAQEFDISKISNSTLLRMLKEIKHVGYVNDPKLMNEISLVQSEMTEIYSNAKWCRSKNECIPMDPDIETLMAETRDYDELLRMWTGWRNVSGAKMRDQYQTFANLTNIAVLRAGMYEDRGAFLRSLYESPTFEEDLKQLFVELRPLYDQLHAYVRRKLQAYYSAHAFPESGHIPAHLFGNMWAQKWTNIYDILAPFPDRKEHSLTDKMKEQGFNVTYMYQVAHNFYTSLGLEPLPKSFWTKSMLVKPKDGRNVVCHASAWDMHTGDDVRIKQCTIVTGDQLMTVHHELGHLFYDMAYSKQPFIYRGGANPGFHEGVADIAMLSFHTPAYLKAIGLGEEGPDVGDENEADINFLLKTAIDRVAFLPFGYLIDQWRWDIYRGDIPPERFNTEWWKLRCYYQGISPPVLRTEESFDPGSKFHIPNDYPYIRYFVSYVAQFQWHKALCEIIGHTGPLHKCTIFKQKAAGDRLRSMLEMGMSKPWGEAMRTLTRGTSGETDKLSTRALLDYFKPLQEWLEKDNKAAGQEVGWDRTVCPNVEDPDMTSSSAKPPMARLGLITASFLYLVIRGFTHVILV